MISLVWHFRREYFEITPDRNKQGVLLAPPFPSHLELLSQKEKEIAQTKTSNQPKTFPLLFPIL
jgi:hypothetical protein